MRALWKHFCITLLLNYKSGRALLYGYLMPILFLIGFGTVFQSGHPRLLEQMGQILTITILGSTCLGMATALVSERERGLWRHYQLLPIPTHRLLISVMSVRFIIVGLAVLLQMVLAKWIYGTPFPGHPVLFILVFPIVVFGFLGLALILTAMAKDVPSVQALGQCIFLPMILIGGVGIPLIALPSWAKMVATFMPGRYAVELLQSCYQSAPLPIGSILFPILALLGIGIVAMIAGLKILHWDRYQPVSKRSILWIAIALVAWLGVGSLAILTERVDSSGQLNTITLADISEQQLNAIDFETLPEDNGFYTPLAPPLKGQRLTFRMKEFQPRLEQWKPAQVPNNTQAVLNLLCVAANSDIVQDRSEATIARMVFDNMQQQFEVQELTQVLAWIILNPDSGRVLTSIPELGLSMEVHPDIVRERCNWYARKYLGRLIGKISENE